MKIYVANVASRTEVSNLAKVGVSFVGLNFIREDENFIKAVPSLVGQIPNFSREEIESLKNNINVSKDLQIERIGMFKDDMPQTIITKMMVYKLNIIHLIGEELPLMIDNLKRSIMPDLKAKIKVFKDIIIEKESHWQASKNFENYADALTFKLCDELCTENKASEIVNSINALKLSTPYYIYGKLTPQFVSKLKKLSSPLFQGIILDKEITLNNKKKDLLALKHFIDMIE